MAMIVLILISSYIVGSISISFFAGKILRGIDIRDYGSGNLGATNVYRILGLRAAIVVVCGDILKGLVPILSVNLLYDLGFLVLSPPKLDLLKIGAGLSVIIGHLFPIFHKFKGGKGVATSTGVFLGLTPVVMMVVFIVFFIIVILTRYVSVGSIVGALLMPILMWFRGEGTFVTLFGVVVGILVIMRHIPNIKRLLKGRESRFGERVRLD